MSTRSRRIGADWELRLLRWFREHHLPTERLRLAGMRDEGDLAVQDVGLVYLVEAKAEQKIDLSGYVNEATVERDNYAKARGIDPAHVMPIVIIKRRSHGVEKAYVVTTVEEFFGSGC